MSKPPKTPQNLPSRAASNARAEREARLAAALRTNLKRRKAPSPPRKPQAESEIE